MSTEQVPWLFRLCSDGLSIEAIPRKPLDLAWEKYEGNQQLTLMVRTPYFIVFRFSDGPEVTLRKDGRMIIRRIRNEQAARQIALRALSIGRT